MQQSWMQLLPASPGPKSSEAARLRFVTMVKERTGGDTCPCCCEFFLVVPDPSYFSSHMVKCATTTGNDVPKNFEKIMADVAGPLSARDGERAKRAAKPPAPPSPPPPAAAAPRPKAAAPPAKASAKAPAAQQAQQPAVGKKRKAGEVAGGAVE